jgi:alpha-glucoside transport system substrate-binding protein
MRHLAGADAQEIWVKQGGFTSVNKDVEMSAYPNEIARKQAEQLLNAATFKFDLDDAIGAPFQDAEFAAITQFVASPNRLDSLLASLAQLQGRR